MRLKRRRKYKQYKPYQIKKNYNKYHYYIRKNILKQTYIYRKYIYLKSKPKPYSKQPKKIIPLNQRPLINSPPTNIPKPTSQQITSLFPNNNKLTKTLIPNNTISSPPLPFPFKLPSKPTTQTKSKFKPPTNITPNLFNNIYKHKNSNPTLSLSKPINNHQSPLIPNLTNNSLTSPISNFNNTFPRPSIHIPLPHSIRKSPLIHYPKYNKTIINETRPNIQSPYIYSPPSLRPPLPNSISPINISPFNRNPIKKYLNKPPNKPTYLPNNPNLYKPFTSIPSTSPKYPYSTQSKFSHNTTIYPSTPSLPNYSKLKIHPSLHPSTIPNNNPHYKTFQTPSFTSNQSIEYPKNEQYPPTSQTLNTQLIQKKYKSTPNSKNNINSKNKTKKSKNNSTTNKIKLTKQTKNIFNLTKKKKRNSSSSNYFNYSSRKNKYKLPPIPTTPLFYTNIP